MSDRPRTMTEWSAVTLANSRRWFPPPDPDHQRLTGRSSGRTWEIEHQAYGIGGESGEIVEHVKKWHRGDITADDLSERLASELPDLLCYTLNMCALLGLDADAILAAKQAVCESRWGVR